MIIEKSEDYYLRYFVIDKINTNDKKFLNLLRNKTIRQIILILYWEVAISRKDISKYLNIPPTTVGFYLKKLKSYGIIEHADICEEGIISSTGGIVERSPIGREKFYRLKDIRLLWDLLITYQGSFSDDYTGDLLIPVKKNPDRFKTFDTRVEDTIKLIFELMPIPFCA